MPGARRVLLGLAAWLLAAGSTRAAAPPVELAPGIDLLVPAGWSVAPRFYSNAVELLGLPEQRASEYRSAWDTPGLDTWTARAVAMVEVRRDAADAESRLLALAGSGRGEVVWSSVGGWPAMQRTTDGTLSPKPRLERVREVPATFVSVAVAVGARIVHLEITLPRGDAERLADAQAIAAGLRFAAPGSGDATAAALERLRRAPVDDGPRPAGFAASAAPQQASSDLGTNVYAQGGAETEIVASADGVHVVVASQNNLRTSHDGGQSFTVSNSMPFSNFGDPSLALGQSGAFYLAGINNTAGCGNFGCATGIARSTDNGQSFPFRANAVTCPTSGGGACFPDQEHLAADRWNAAPGGDQVYSVWRNFTSGELPTIVCSQDGGLNWTAPATVDAAGKWARVAVGGDGFVYVVYADDPNGSGDIRLHKYSSCASGLVPQAGFPVTVFANYDGVACPVPGLDRCNRRNTLASYTLAADDTNPSHLYLAFAENDGSGEDVLVLDSTDGGATWPRSVAVNAASNAPRFMPWLCAMNGTAHVGWYDRRSATVANNDLTAYFRGSASVIGGNLVAGAEVNVSGVGDASCGAGWPCATDQQSDAESCSIQPQLAGICQDGSGVSSTNQRCDFTTGPACPSGESCSIRRGCPKYGDYTGIACGGGYVFVTWASATPPAGVTAPGGINTFVGVDRIGAAPDLQLTLTDAPDPVIALQTYAYTLSANNLGPTLAAGVTLADPLPPGVTFVSIAAPGWSCNTPAVGANGLVSCSLGALASNTAASPITLTVRAPDAITTVSNTATLAASTTDPTPADNVRNVTTTVISPAVLSATKELTSSGPYAQYAAVRYLVTMSNAGPGAQFDNPGDEFVDTLPGTLDLLAANASAGTASTGGGTVHWNGKIPAGGSVAITIDAAVAVASHQTIANQGQVSFDATGDGANDSTAPSDDPTVGGTSDPTVFESLSVIEVPTLGGAGRLLLGMLLLAGAAWVLARQRG
ncbi:MAG: DUF11 domain-containing protein [Holophagales bacterium]|nr:MAG: DUF11 domain-containing protein [Holophagales bacterium]